MNLSSNKSSQDIHLPIDKATGRFYWLDLLRFLAAFAVLINHFRADVFTDYYNLPLDQQTGMMSFFYLITRLGYEAVLIFFVLSGFLVFGRLIERLRNNTFNPVNYAIDRSVRIMLPLISAVVFVAIASIICDNPKDTDFVDYIGNIFSLQGVFVKPINGSFWSLAYEVWFYILAGAFAVVFISKKRSNSTLALFVAFISILVFSKLYCLYLLIWVLGGIAYASIGIKKSRWALYGSLIAICACIIALQATCASQRPTGILNYLPTTNRGAISIWFSIFVCIFIKQIILFKPRFKFTSFIERKGTKLAAFSYTLYLTHNPVRWLLEKAGVPMKMERVNFESISVFIFTIVVALVVAYCIYWCFEKRTPQVKAFIRKKISKHKNDIQPV